MSSYCVYYRISVCKRRKLTRCNRIRAVSQWHGRHNRSMSLWCCSNCRNKVHTCSPCKRGDGRYITLFWFMTIVNKTFESYLIVPRQWSRRSLIMPVKCEEGGGGRDGRATYCTCLKFYSIMLEIGTMPKPKLWLFSIPQFYQLDFNCN